ncbi:hypothetical protein OU995_05140 [Roseateles sp. SL47]|uniref:hypothetical protein n=1 Tax=Roseateles sp. SL47 TaxID=2995138 RepID=UPI00227058FC|nr:hypothetical protein [Roseateles sp. SL47]WAC74117.1 hypothetical protein OU995_05140 [Roseateles sp. SL47]
MGQADHFQTFHLHADDSGAQIHWASVSDMESLLGLEAALPYLTDHAPATFAEPAPAVVSNPRHAA